MKLAYSRPTGIVVGQDACDFVCRKTDTISRGGVGVGLKRNGIIVAAAMFDHYLGNSIQIHIAIDGPLTRECPFVAFDYPFRQAQVKKLLAHIDSTNEKSIHFAERTGFTKEACIQDGGRYADLLIYSMTKEQCRYLGRKNA